MAGKGSGKGPGGVSWVVIIPVAHAVFDIAAKASCPDCGQQVVLYVCTNCKKPVWPDRGQAAA